MENEMRTLAFHSLKRNIDNYYVHSSVAYHLSLSIPITVIQIDTHICKMLQSISLTLGLNGDFEQCTVIFQSPSSSISITRAKIPLP